MNIQNKIIMEFEAIEITRGDEHRTKNAMSGCAFKESV